MDRSTSGNSSPTERSSSLVHLAFPTHEINFFNPPKSNPNGNLNGKLILGASLEEEQPELEIPNNRKWHDNLPSPWAISSILILLLANVVSGTIVFFQNHQEITLNASANPSTQEPSSIGGPNLAAAEFIDLNLSTLSTISNSAVTSTESSQKLDPARVSVTANPLLSLNGENEQIPNSSGQIQTNYYYVFTEYSGDRSLALAKQKVSNVSLINFPQGVFIYLGAFQQKAYAQQFVAQLKKEGIDAYVYPLD
ncbi:SPOR domain-containing protein [Pleurocapsales cyanobacterium LEGE 06147]|nr:SPOR domain-containing protein [Pleurocapsales cyanobacterium LEGE 06147]